MVQAVLKLGYQGQFHRVRFERDEVAYDDVLGLIKRTLPEAAGYQAKYRDDEGDLCTLCALTFPDFLLSFQDKGAFKLELVSVPESPRAPASTRAAQSRQVCSEDPAAASVSDKQAAAETGAIAGTQEGPRPCAMGCGLAATWHRKYCCGLCGGGHGRHGPRCEGRRMPEAVKPAEIERAAGEQRADSTEDAPPASASDGQDAPKDMQAMGAGTGPQQAGTDEKPPRQPRPCANGCGFAATWHPHYCCGRCIATGKHGPRCEMKRVHQAAEDLDGPAREAQHVACGARTEEAPWAAADAKAISDNEEGCTDVSQPFAAELQQLEEMGFEVSGVLREAIQQHNGDIAKLLVAMGLS